MMHNTGWWEKERCSEKDCATLQSNRCYINSTSFVSCAGNFIISSPTRHLSHVRKLSLSNEIVSKFIKDFTHVNQDCTEEELQEQYLLSDEKFVIKFDLENTVHAEPN